MSPRAHGSGGDADVLVVGGGPAGLVFATRAAQRGLAVTVLDRARPPVDKPCGEGLMPDGVARLVDLGVRIQDLDGQPFRGIRYLDEETPAEGEFPGEPGLGIRRTRLHRALVRAAESAGVGLRWGTRVQGLVPGEPGTGRAWWGLRTREGEHDADLVAPWIVGADGLRSKVRRWAGLDRGPGRRQRFGVRRHLGVLPWTDRVEVYWAEGCEAYVTPVGSGEVGVAILWSPQGIPPGERPSFDTLLPRFPLLQERLQGAPVTSRNRGAGPFHQRVRAVHRGRVALLGDAAGYVDALTGEGLSVAFHEAFALVDAIETGDLRAYGRAVQRLRRLPDLLTRLLLLVERRPGLRRRMIRTFAADPRLFSCLLGIHARQRPPASLGLAGAWRLGWGLVGGSGRS